MLLSPGAGAAFYNPNSSNLTIIFVGTVPGGLLTNSLNPGLNLVSSILPASGDLSTNSLLTFPSSAGGQYDGDQLFMLFSTLTGSDGYTTFTADSLSYNPPGNNGWDGLPGQPDPILAYPGQAFWYRAGHGSLQWTESYYVSEIARRDTVKPKASLTGSPVRRRLDAARSPALLKGGHVQATFTGEARQLHVVEVSSDLRNWQAAATNLWSSDRFVYTDPAPATNKARFYRGFALP
jgi:hypothetical protein